MAGPSKPKRNGPPAETPEEKRREWENYCVRRHDSYSREREAFDKSCVEISGRFDKAILILPAGAIGYSMTFMKGIAPSPSEMSFVLLGFAWLFLIVALATGLHAVLWSQYAIGSEINNLDAAQRHFEEFGLEREFTPAQNRYSDLTNLCNKVSIWTFTMGLALLCVFAFANLPRRKTEKEPVNSSPAPISVPQIRQSIL